MSLPSPQSEWYTNREAVLVLLTYMAGLCETDKSDLVHAAEKPWKYTDEYEHALYALEEEDRCPICHGKFTVPIAGPDENGQYDTDDCPCQLGMPSEEFDSMREDSAERVVLRESAEHYRRLEA